MQIPEVLLKKSDKELKKLLSEDNIFKCKFFCKEDIIHERKQNILKHTVTTKGRAIFNEDLVDYYTPLTYNRYTQIKEANSYQHLSDKLTSSQYFNIVSKKFIEVFGEERVDAKPYNHEILLHIPELKITNSLELEHTMRDMYIKFYIDDKYICIPELYRTTLTLSEIHNNYYFSHIRGNGVGRWVSQWCLGDGQFKQVWRNCIDSGDIIKALKNLTYFLHSFIEYLSWESIEGKPYHYILNLFDNKKGLNSVIIPYSSQYIDRLYKKVIENIDNLTYDLELNDNNQYIVKLNSNIVSSIDDILTQNCEERYIRVGNGSYTQSSNTVDSNIEKYHGKDSNVLFKGQVVKFNIIDDSKEYKDEDKKVDIHLLNSIVKRIEDNLMDYIINLKISA